MSTETNPGAPRRIHLGSDHGGVNLRRHLVDVLTQDGHRVVSEHGPASSETSVDYPDVAREVTAAVREDPGSFGLIVCGTGQGVAMTANKTPGIRAAVCGDEFSATMARAHNDANVLCLGERVVGPGLADTIVRAFMATAFESGGRHSRRVGKIEPTKE